MVIQDDSSIKNVGSTIRHGGLKIEDGGSFMKNVVSLGLTNRKRVSWDIAHDSQLDMIGFV